MTEVLHYISNFLSHNATAGNLTAIIGTVATMVLARLNAKLKVAVATKKQELEANGTDVAKLTNAMLELTNMFAVAFIGSKLDTATKLKIQELQNSIFKSLTETSVEKEVVEIKEEVVNKEELVEEKSALDKLKEDL